MAIPVPEFPRGREGRCGCWHRPGKKTRHCLSGTGRSISRAMKTLGFVVAILLSLCVGRAGEFDQTHSTLDRLLKARVKNERVDYVALKKDSKDLNAWLKSAGAVTEAEFNRWTQPQQVA